MYCLTFAETAHLPPDERDRVDWYLTGLYRQTYGLQSEHGEDYLGIHRDYYTNRAILGQLKYKYHLDVTLAELGIKRQEVTSKIHGCQLCFFKPITQHFTGTVKTITNRHLIRTITGIQKKKKAGLSYEAKVSFKNLRDLRFNCTKQQFFIIMKSGYNDYCCGKRAEGKQPLELEEYMNEQEIFWGQIELFRKCRYDIDYIDFLSECDFGNRLHSLMTRIPGILKRSGFVTYKGKPIAGNDLHQSQMVILALYLESVLGKNSFTETLRAVPDIYEYIQEKLGLESRDAAKTATYQIFYGIPYGKSQEILEKLFPDIAGFIKKLKSVKNPNNPSDKIYSNLAYEMQQFESRLFRKVWREIHRQGIWFLTIHDEIISTQEDSGRVKEIMERILKEELNGLNVTVKTKYYELWEIAKVDSEETTGQREKTG